MIELFLIGVGGVGGALLEQVKRQQEWLKKKHIDLRVCGIANSKALLTNVHGLNRKLAGRVERGKRAVQPWASDPSGERVSPAESGDCRLYVEPAVADQYADFLREGFHVVTPNKRPTPRRWITITSCVWRRANRAASSCTTLTWGGPAGYRKPAEPAECGRRTATFLRHSLRFAVLYFR